MVDEPYLVAALHRHVPDTRRFGQLRVIQLRTVGGFECFEASAFGDLHRSTTSRRDLPDLPITRSVRSKVDPAFISRPARPSVVRDVVRDGAHATALGGNHIDVIGPRSVRIEGDQPPVGAPTGATHENGAERCQLHRLRTVAFGYPNLVTPRPQGDKHDPLAVGERTGEPCQQRWKRRAARARCVRSRARAPAVPAFSRCFYPSSYSDKRRVSRFEQRTVSRHVHWLALAAVVPLRSDRKSVV